MLPLIALRKDIPSTRDGCTIRFFHILDKQQIKIECALEIFRSKMSLVSPESGSWAKWFRDTAFWGTVGGVIAYYGLLALPEVAGNVAEAWGLGDSRLAIEGLNLPGVGQGEAIAEITGDIGSAVMNTIAA